MLRWVRNAWCTGRALLAAAAGTALALAFPLPGWAGLAWVAPGLLLLATAGTRGGHVFRLGYLAGLCHNFIALRWLLHIPFPAGAVAGWLALSAYLALYPALWVWLCWRFFPRHGFPPPRRPQRPRTTCHAGWLLFSRSPCSPGFPAFFGGCSVPPRGSPPT
ncbi:MAG: hypothetical protein M5U12_15010 [Verrucomicrobia bacterium]|nr:hypothetical protein [Verrucomicrobiota bacterium]